MATFFSVLSALKPVYTETSLCAAAFTNPQEEHPAADSVEVARHVVQEALANAQLPPVGIALVWKCRAATQAGGFPAQIGNEAGKHGGWSHKNENVDLKTRNKASDEMSLVQPRKIFPSISNLKFPFEGLFLSPTLFLSFRGASKVSSSPW